MLLLLLLLLLCNGSERSHQPNPPTASNTVSDVLSGCSGGNTVEVEVRIFVSSFSIVCQLCLPSLHVVLSDFSPLVSLQCLLVQCL